MIVSVPEVSVGLAVRNAQDVVGRCIESVLTQDFTNLELVVSDNASDDGTRELISDLARSDPRIKLSVNEVNVGILANVNRVLELSSGTFFRWISSDDWLAPGCLSDCVGELRAREDAIGITTNFTFHTADGSTISEDYRGEFPTSPDPARRFERMLWFFHAGDAKYDPLYGMYRREALLRARRQGGSENADWLLAAELALTGPILHRHVPLANRTRPDHNVDPAALRRRYSPHRPETLKSSPRRLYNDLLELVLEADLTDEQLRRCKSALRRFASKHVVFWGRKRLARAKRRVLRR
jgi:glycosyltransferase involved in cell wall biosynthesis